MYHVTRANMKRMIGPAAHPIVLMAHARERTPDPITAVMMWAPAVTQLPAAQTDRCHYLQPSEVMGRSKCDNIVQHLLRDDLKHGVLYAGERSVAPISC